MTHKNKNLKGFTLIELIVVIMIIGALSAILIPTMIRYVKKARIKAAIADAKAVMIAVESSLVDNMVNADYDTTPAFNKVLYLDKNKNKGWKDREYEQVGAFTNYTWNIYKSGENKAQTGSQAIDLVIATALDNKFSESWDKGKRTNPMSYNNNTKNCRKYLEDNDTNFGLVIVYNPEGRVRMMQLFRNDVLVTYIDGAYIVNTDKNAHFVGTNTWDSIYKESDKNKGSAPEEYCKINLSNQQIGNSGNLGGWY